MSLKYVISHSIRMNEEEEDKNNFQQASKTNKKIIGILDVDPESIHEKPFFTEPETIEAMSQLGYSTNDLVIIDTDRIPDLPPQEDIRNSVKKELDKRRIQMIQNIIDKRNSLINDNTDLNSGKKKSTIKKRKKIHQSSTNDNESSQISSSEQETNEKSKKKKKKAKKHPKQISKDNSASQVKTKRSHVQHTDEEIKEMVLSTHHLNRPAPISDPDYQVQRLRKRKKKVKVDPFEVRKKAIEKKNKAELRKINLEAKKKEKKEIECLKNAENHRLEKVQHMQEMRKKHEKDLDKISKLQLEEQRKLAKKTLLKYDQAEKRRKEARQQQMIEMKKKAKEREERIKKAELEAKRLQEEKQKKLEKKLLENDKRSQLVLSNRQKEIAAEFRRRKKIEFDKAKRVCIPKVNKTVI